MKGRKVLIPTMKELWFIPTISAFFVAIVYNNGYRGVARREGYFTETEMVTCPNVTLHMSAVLGDDIDFIVAHGRKMIRCHPKRVIVTIDLPHMGVKRKKTYKTNETAADRKQCASIRTNAFVYCITAERRARLWNRVTALPTNHLFINTPAYLAAYVLTTTPLFVHIDSDIKKTIGSVKTFLNRCGQNVKVAPLCHWNVFGGNISTRLFCASSTLPPLTAINVYQQNPEDLLTEAYTIQNTTIQWDSSLCYT